MSQGAVFLELFLSLPEKDNLGEWHEVSIDRSFVNHSCKGLFNWLAGFIPAAVAPNVMTLIGSAAVFQAWCFCETHAESQPAVVTCIAMASITLYWLLSGMDEAHARHAFLGDTALSQLFRYVCHLISAVVLVAMVCRLVLEPDLHSRWYCVQTVQILLLVKHHSAFMQKAALSFWLVGPGELFVCSLALLTVVGAFGRQAVMQTLYSNTWGSLCDVLTDNFENLSEAELHPARVAYLSVIYLSFGALVLSRRRREGQGRHARTRGMLAVVLLLRGLAGWLHTTLEPTQSASGAVPDGLFMAMVTSDVIVAKMAGRELHPWMVLMTSTVMLPQMHFLTIGFVVFYYIAVFVDLMRHLNLPLLQVVRNVYCDGIYDLSHVGHKNLFRRAVQLGNRLYVGVNGDADASKYKRPPVMSAAEREREVAACKCVTKVISNAPCFGLTEEFIQKHRIHVVAFGQEYLDRYPDPEQDPYYKVPRKMGIAVPMPRSWEMSTSDLIQRIQNRGTDSKKSPT